MNSALFRITVGIFTALLVIDVIGMMVIQPFEISSNDLRKLLKTSGTMGLVFLVGTIAKRRLVTGGDSDAPKLAYMADITQILGMVGGYMIVISVLMAILNYMLMGVSFPLRDDMFASMDRAMGFDWISVLQWVEVRPAFSWVLVKVYSSSLAQMMAVIFIYSALRRPDRVLEFTALYAITGSVVAIVAMLFPSMGAHFYYQPDPELIDQYTNLGYVHIQTLEQLRAGTFQRLELNNLVGMVSFPSFHTILAIIVTYAFRDNRFLFVPVAVLNCLVVVSTLTEGGHYLIDIVGGTAIAVAAILFVRAVAPGEQKVATQPAFS